MTNYSRNLTFFLLNSIHKIWVELICESWISTWINHGPSNNRYAAL